MRQERGPRDDGTCVAVPGTASDLRHLLPVLTLTTLWGVEGAERLAPDELDELDELADEDGDAVDASPVPR